MKLEMMHVAIVPGGFEIGYRRQMSETEKPFAWGEFVYVGEPAKHAGHPLLRCGSCDEVFVDTNGSSIGGLAPYECPRCGEESNLSVIDADAPQPDSAEMADAYERKAAELDTAQAGSHAQDAGRIAAAASFRRKATEIRGRLAT